MNFWWEATQSGYTEAIYDVTDFLADGEENLIAVRVDAQLGEGWFYEGGGIYRHVWLVTTPLVSIDFHGVWVKSQVDLEKDTAQLTIQTKVVNRSGKAQETAVSHCVTAPDGQQVSIEPTSVLVDGWAEQTVEQTLSLPHPQLWDLETPRLYTVETRLDGEKDTVTEFGIRSIRFDTDLGIFPERATPKTERRLLPPGSRRAGNRFTGRHVGIPYWQAERNGMQRLPLRSQSRFGRVAPGLRHFGNVGDG